MSAIIKLCVSCENEPPAFPEGGVGFNCARKSLDKAGRHVHGRRPSSRVVRIEKRLHKFRGKLMPLVSVTLKDLRDARGISQQQLADRSGVGMKTISSFETGERTWTMKVTQLGDICCALGITLSEFFEEVDRRAWSTDV